MKTPTNITPPPPNILLYSANKWLCEYLVFYLTRDFEVTCIFTPENLEADLDPKVIITDYDEDDFVRLSALYPSAPVFLLSHAEVEEENTAIVKQYHYPMDPDTLIGEVKYFLSLDKSAQRSYK